MSRFTNSSYFKRKEVQYILIKNRVFFVFKLYSPINQYGEIWETVMTSATSIKHSSWVQNLQYEVQKMSFCKMSLKLPLILLETIMAKTLTSLKYTYTQITLMISHISSSEDTSTSCDDSSPEQPYLGPDL